MKKLSIEEKAKAYDEAIERAKNVLLDCTPEEQKVVEYIYPELKESEDERIRKRIIHALHGDVLDMEETTKAIAWLEKQDKKSADKIEPKFKKGDIIKEKETGNLFYVNSVEDFGYTLYYKNCITKGCTMEFKYEDNYELAPSWGEDDEKIISDIDDCIKNLPIFYETIKINGEDKITKQFVYCVRNWLDSLKDRVQ